MARNNESAAVLRSSAAAQLGVRERDFVTAGRATGASGSRIVVRHLLPSRVGLVIKVSAIDVGGIILLEFALSFLGLGIQPYPAR